MKTVQFELINHFLIKIVVKKNQLLIILIEFLN